MKYSILIFCTLFAHLEFVYPQNWESHKKQVEYHKKRRDSILDDGYQRLDSLFLARNMDEYFRYHKELHKVFTREVERQKAAYDERIRQLIQNEEKRNRIRYTITAILLVLLIAIIITTRIQENRLKKAYFKRLMEKEEDDQAGQEEYNSHLENH